ncbi:Hint domain-containing protein [Celeribacter neptunius]|uniref:Hint domain-containing protein n=1 Tax=Celeribacter neptunius TaxID=588602 RepID=A0A1I3KB74_9RHOB|nr:Hint domain-containing protein [Celeribacter neptunius]SFI69548.1 Hint domain-containing protein [Celeribacter neptunius]
MSVVAVWDLQDVTFTGTPFASGATADASDVGTTFTINAGPQLVDFSDDDGFFEDADSSQDLVSPVTLGGTTYTAGDAVENEYSYIVRPVGGATDGSEDVTIYAFEVSADVVGMASDGYLKPGTTYEIIAKDSDDPVVAYSAMFVCFVAGTRIATPSGPRPVEELRVGDLVATREGGDQPLIWCGQSTVPGEGAQAAIRFGPKAVAALGGAPSRAPLLVSPQHRMFWPDPEHGPRLVPAKAFLGWRDVRAARRRQQHYVHLMLAEHALLESAGIWSESFNPGPQALRSLPARMRAQILSRFPAAADRRVFPDLYPVDRVGPFRRRLGLPPLANHMLSRRAKKAPRERRGQGERTCETSGR